MRFNQRGNLAHGVGPFGVDQILLYQGQYPRWLDNDHILLNSALGHTLRFTSPSWLPPVEIDPRGITNIACGGGNYVIEVASTPRAVYGQWGGRDITLDSALYATLEPLHPMDGWWDGTLLFASADYQQLGLLHPNHLWDWYTVGAHWQPRTVRCIENGFVYYDEEHPGHIMMQLGTAQPDAIPTLVDFPDSPYSFTNQGVRWYLYHFDYTYLQREATNEGYILPASFSPDVYVFNRSARIATTPLVSESPESITISTIETLGENTTIIVPIGPPPKPVLINRACWFGWFHFAHTPTPAPPQNCGVYVGSDGPGSGYVLTNDGRKVAQFVEYGPDEENVELLNQMIRAAEAKDPNTPVVPYLTYQMQADNVRLASPLHGIEAYWKVWETEQQFEDRLRRELARVPGSWLFGQAYTSNTQHVTDLAAVARVIGRVMQGAGQLLWFSGSQRGTGYQDHPEMWPTYEAMYASVTGEGPLPVAPPPATFLPRATVLGATK